MIFYESTRGSKETKSSSQAIIKGIAEDDGLYVPNSIPRLPFTIEEMVGKSYKEIAFPVMKAFFKDFSDEELKNCIDRAYDSKFEEKDIAPLKKAGDAYFLELYHGKTAAFKDMALSILPYLLTTAMRKEKEEHKICILTATSGDTGKAALEGFANVPGTEIIVFYPSEGVSQVQERQMTTQEGDNTHVFAIEGNFDDAQTGVKKIFADREFSKELAKVNCKLSSANSINIGRLIPQVVYYVYGYIKMVEKGEIKNGEAINAVVPTGNFGNILAAYYAGQMGIPVKKYICASNENNVLTDFISTGTYDINRPFYLTDSPSMDILISSNLERLLYHLNERNGEEVASLMGALKKEKRYTVGEKIQRGLKDFYGGYASGERAVESMGVMYKENNYLMDTHTAVAYRVCRDYKEKTGDETPCLIASTASAYKFAESVSDGIGIGRGEDGFASIDKLHDITGVKVPSGLCGLKDKVIHHKTVVKVEDMPAAVKRAIS